MTVWQQKQKYKVAMVDALTKPGNGVRQRARLIVPTDDNTVGLEEYVTSGSMNFF